MTSISHREMRNNSAEVLRRVEAGEVIVVTNRGEPVAELVPIRRSVLDDLAARGLTRPATRPVSSLRSITRVKLDDGESTADIVADLRGYDRGY